jgi:hypothetical protein
MVSLRLVVRASVVSVLLASLAVIGSGVMASGTASASPSNCYPIGSASCRYWSGTRLARSTATAKVVYGSETSETLSVKVSGAHGTPTGKVTISGVCTAALSGGKAKCTLTGNQLAVGWHVLRATYSGNSMYRASKSNKVGIRVVK